MTTIRSTHRLLGLSAILILTGTAWGQNTYHASIDAWRTEREATIKADDGWLTVTGLFWLKEGRNNFGTGADNEIVLPSGSGPTRAGTFLLKEGKITLQVVEDADVSLAGKAIHSLDVKTDAKGPPDVLRIADLSLTVIKRGQRYGVRLKDRHSRNRKEFTGLRWYPVQESFRIAARFIPYDQPKEIEIVNVIGDVEKSKSPGVLTFTLQGQQYRLEPIVDEGKLFIIFKDLTSGKTTYPAGRFLYAEAPKDAPKESIVTLDFNQAINPPCAFTAFATCPLPPRQNRLNIAIEAGEQTYHAGGVIPNNRQKRRSRR
ncbi:MAG TPA: DUF1684 domain-containing protein [Blastocatellia bacterium]|jgi:hypothetical protein|nr:DUF1684 domain-containing protein [Blastocatellia bacterium]